MKREDYIKGATSKIFSHSEKKKVEAELNDHILKSKEFSEEIGYEADTAEDNAVEKMGEYDDISEQLGELHNDYYTPVGDIIGFAVWLAILGGSYYVLNKYIFGDIGAIPITLAAICVSMAVFFIAAGIMLSRNRLPVIIGTLLCGGATAAFIYFCAEDINKQISGNLTRLKELIFHYQIVSGTIESNKITPITVGIFSAFALFAITVSLIYYIKYHTESNSFFDNYFRKFVKRLSVIPVIIFILFAAFFGTRFFSIQNYLYDEYKNTYQVLLDMSTQCQTFDEVKEYISSNKLSFINGKKLIDGPSLVEYTDENENITGYKYNHNLVDVIISKYDKYDYSEDYTVIPGYGLADAQTNVNYDYQISLILSNQNYFKDKLDSISLKKFKTSEDELDKITLFDMEEHSYEDKFEFYKTHLPNTFKCFPAKSENNKGAYTFNFITGNGKYKYTSEFFITIYPDSPEKYLNVLNKEKEISEIVKDNINCSPEEIAKRTSTTISAPEIAYEDYAKTVNTLGSFFNDYKEELLNSYNQQYKFKVSDDLYFYITEDYIYFSSDSKLEYINFYPLTEDAKYASMSQEPYKKMSVCGKGKGYYAKNKLAYSYDRIPYFEKDGTRYTIHTKDEDPGDNSGYIKRYYLANQKGEIYKAEDCYINKEGYLYFDTNHTLKVQDDGLTYKDRNGDTYTKALETSWDENGNIIPFDDSQ